MKTSVKFTPTASTASTVAVQHWPETSGWSTSTSRIAQWSMSTSNKAQSGRRRPVEKRQDGRHRPVEKQTSVWSTSTSWKCQWSTLTSRIAQKRQWSTVNGQRSTSQGWRFHHPLYFCQFFFWGSLNIFCTYILMKRDISSNLFLFCQIWGFMCKYKSINNLRSRRSNNILNICTVIIK